MFAACRLKRRMYKKFKNLLDRFLFSYFQGLYNLVSKQKFSERAKILRDQNIKFEKCNTFSESFNTFLPRNTKNIFTYVLGRGSIHKAFTPFLAF